jgi:hypothetical protein
MPDEAAPVQVLDPLVQVVTGLPGTRPDGQVNSAAAAVGGSIRGHDDGPSRRRAVAGGDALPGEPGGQVRARASSRTDDQLQQVRDGQLRRD